ncbi:MAG: LacI family DNA-binding transcriptional regulator [Lachnospiraceae bacterium]|nr:LacI family DNA-binding transcriptional regulator [Lachnospiraceae bacterium]
MNQEKKLTIYDIAEIAGVSASTVSRVINNSGYVAPAKRELVIKVIEENEYKPNALAQGLSTRHSQTIGMLVPDAINPFFATIFVTLEKEAAKYGYNVILCNYGNNIEETQRQIQVLVTKQADVVVSLGGPTDLVNMPEDVLSRIKGIVKDVPVITNGGNFDGAFYSAAIDDEPAVMKMIKDAYELGHRRFALIGGSAKYIPTYTKQQAFMRAIREAGLPEDAGIIIDYDNFDRFGGARCVEILENEYKDRFPTIVIGINEAVAIGACHELIGRGYSVPGDVSVAGFDNTYLATFCVPELTSIGCDYEKYARKLMKVILDVLDGKSVKKSCKIESRYERRASIGEAR